MKQEDTLCKQYTCTDNYIIVIHGDPWWLKNDGMKV